MSLSVTNILTKIGMNVGDPVSYTTAQKVIDINLAVDNLLLMLFGEGAGGSWQLDDSNHDDYPIITTNLVSGQRDYSFTSDADGNIILDILKVWALNASSGGEYKELTPVDLWDGSAPKTLYDGDNSTGIPTKYDKLGNGIFLDLIPSYSATDGLKVLINREGTAFLTTDTTKKWGFTGIYHEYLVLWPSYQYARAKNLTNREALKRDLIELEEKIRKHSGLRERDKVKTIKPKVENTR